MSDEEYIKVWTGRRTTGKGIFQQMMETPAAGGAAPCPNDFIEALRDSVFDTAIPSAAPVLANINGRTFLGWPDGRMTVDDEPATEEDRQEWKELFDALFNKPAQ